MKRLTEEQIANIIEDYANGISPKEIGEKYGLFNNSVTRILKKRGIIRNQLERVSADNIQVIIDQYIGGKSSTIIAADFGINDSTVCRILKRNNIPIRSLEINKRKYKINQDYFEKIDTEEKAYFLGFLYAAGNVSKNKNSLRLMLHPKDNDILEKFSLAIYGFSKIESSLPNIKGQIYSYVPIYSKKICKDLLIAGCPPAKSFIIVFPSHIISTNLLRHFVRGYFDGDGCICIKNIGKPVVDFTSNTNFINGIIEYLTNNNIKCNKPQNHTKHILSNSVQITSFDNIYNLYELMYGDATIYMKRKYDIFKQFIFMCKNRISKKFEKSNNIEKYGTTFIPEYNGKQLTSLNIKEMTSLEKDSAAEFSRDFFRNGGFPYPILTSDELIRNFNVLKNTDENSIENNKILRIDNQAGLAIFRHFAPHFFEVKCGLDLNKPSMLEVFNDDKLLLKVIQNRLGFNYHINGNMLRQGISNSKIALKGSVFNPVLAKYIYSKFTKENDIIYDYSMGFGQRLTAALSLPYNVKYIGVDVLEKSVESNKNIFNFLKNNIPNLNKEAVIENIGSENYCDSEFHSKVNLAFSSPPYFNLEHYSNDDTQAYYNNDYNYFINTWWKKTVNNIHTLLISNGLFILNMKEKVNGFDLLKDMVDIIKNQGFEFVDEYKIQLTRNLKFGNRNGVHKYEPILVFKKI